MTTSYSEKELADIAYMKTVCLLTPEKLEDVNAFFNDSTNTNATSFFFLTSSSPRCSDGKRHTGIDYLDFLFPNPSIEDMIAESNTQDRVFTVSLNLTNPQSWSVVYTRK
jgi:hypothetical protein